MDVIADIVLGAGAMGAAVYCYILASRLKRFAALESGMGGAIAVLSAQVDDMTRALEQARSTSLEQATRLEALTLRAEAAAVKLELMMASLHDLPEQKAERKPDPAPEPREEGRIRVRRRRVVRDMEDAE